MNARQSKIKRFKKGGLSRQITQTAWKFQRQEDGRRRVFDWQLIRDLSVGDSAASCQAAESGNVPTLLTCTVTQFRISDSLIVDSHYYLWLLQYTIVIIIVSPHTDMQTHRQRSTVMLRETISYRDRFYFTLSLGAPLHFSAGQTWTASTLWPALRLHGR